MRLLTCILSFLAYIWKLHPHSKRVHATTEKNTKLAYKQKR